jgi:hypothetical protein
MDHITVVAIRHNRAGDRAGLLSTRSAALATGVTSMDAILRILTVTQRRCVPITCMSDATRGRVVCLAPAIYRDKCERALKHG